MLQAVLNLFHATLIFFVLGRSKKITVHKERANILKAFSDIKNLDKTLILFLISLAFISLGMINISKFLEKFMFDQGQSDESIGVFVSITGWVSLGATIFLVPLIASIKKDFSMMIIFQLLSAVIIFIVFRQEEIMVALYSGFMVFIVLKALYTPLEQHYISSHAEEGKYGSVMGVRQLFYSIGLVLGPLIGGFLYEIKPLYVFEFSSVMFLLGVFLLIIVGRKINQRDVKE
jgi:predicted MFS family arabinose efflux permease